MNSINKTKIIFIVTQSEPGGAQRYIFELVSHLNLEKYDILVAAGQGNKEFFEKFSILNLQSSKIEPIKTIQLVHLKRSPHPLKALFSVSEILDLLKKQKPDTLFLCSTTAGILGSIASCLYKTLNTKSKIRIIYRIGGWAFHDPRNWLSNQLILGFEKITAGLKDKIIVNSEFDYRAAVKKKVCSSDKIVKIYNGIDSEKLSFLPKQKAQELLFKNTKNSIEDTKYMIGAVANFYRTKGLNHLIKAMSLLELKYKPLNAKCIIIGDGKQRPELEKLIEKYGLQKKVFLIGRITDAYKYLKAFDVFILPSLKEGFPWIILEAMAAKIPVIATKVGATPEIIENNKQGILIEPKNPEQIAENANILMKNLDLTQKLINNASLRLKDFSALKMTQETEELFE